MASCLTVGEIETDDAKSAAYIERGKPGHAGVAHMAACTVSQHQYAALVAVGRRIDACGYAALSGVDVPGGRHWTG